jgi:hypothetical protein
MLDAKFAIHKGKVRNNLPFAGLDGPPGEREELVTKELWAAVAQELHGQVQQIPMSLLFCYKWDLQFTTNSAVLPRRYTDVICFLCHP